MGNWFSNVKKYIKRLKIDKHHLDWIAGALSIPVLLTVIILNLNNLNSQKKNSPTPTPAEKVIVVPQNNNQTTPVAQPTNATCKKEIGPISITSPREEQTVDTNPVNVAIKYNDPNYCSVVWSYRINNGSWSDYNSNSPSLYNLPSGDIKFDLRIQSTVSQDTDIITRNFTYQGPTPTPTSTPTSSENQ